MTIAAPNSSSAPAHAAPIRAFGRFELRRLLGKSTSSMVWLAYDPRAGSDVMLTLPRVQPADSGALELWQRNVRLAARLNHPHLATPTEIGVQDHWPFVAVDRTRGVTLSERLAQHPTPKPAEAVAWICGALEGLAFAHEAGVAHLDLQLHSLLLDERGGVAVMALGAAGNAPTTTDDAVRGKSIERSMAMDPSELRAQRALGARDLLACGVLLHHLLTGQPALEQPDTALVITRMAPLGRELVRLPWSTPLPIPEALRAIANRCTSGQERLRYRNPRTLLGALNGWLAAQSEDGGGPLALLADRLRTVGHLPALPGLALRVAHITRLESQRTDEIADQVLDDMALSFELLRTLNTAQVQGTQIQGNGPVLTLRRIISLIGVNGVRQAANALRTWPGPLSEPQAAALQATLDQVRLAGHLAQALRPPGYDAQVVYLITVLQNLGRLMARYHFADEAEQIEQLMKPGQGPREPDAPEQPGLSAEAAAFAVLGTDIESLGAVVGRQWGLGDDVMHMARRLPSDAAVRKPDTDVEVLRLTASLANDLVDVLHRQSGARGAAALAQVAQHYGRALSITAREVTEALQSAREALRQGTVPARPATAEAT
ncbi:MAG: HDOD domain-containing protein [Pseudomonadota bacterium]|nr:HDOD domain-containing protein [Pseudomonadota bacterium]